MSKPIIKAIFPVAGLGTRFLPATKASPKEMLPVIDKPLIQYAVEEAVSAGITELIFVTSGSKRAIEDHFDKNYELETKLQERSKHRLLESIINIIPKGVHCTYIRQQEALGLGHAILCAQHLISDDEYFAVLLADDLIIHPEQGVLDQMIEQFNTQPAQMMGVQTIDPKHTDQYGIVKVDDQQRITEMVEKPKPEQAPSNLGVVGRYLLHGDIFKELQSTQSGEGNEIQLTDGIAHMLEQHLTLAYEYQGTRYDCGSKLGYLKANFDLTLTHSELGEAFSEYVRSRI